MINIQLSQKKLSRLFGDNRLELGGFKELQFFKTGFKPTQLGLYGRILSSQSCNINAGNNIQTINFVV